MRLNKRKKIQKHSAKIIQSLMKLNRMENKRKRINSIDKRQICVLKMIIYHNIIKIKNIRDSIDEVTHGFETEIRLQLSEINDICIKVHQNQLYTRLLMEEIYSRT